MSLDEHTERLNRYVAAAAQAAEHRAAEIARMRACRFDTIAVHGLYTLSEALDFNQGSIIEPVYLSSSQGYRDSDEMEAALSYQIPRQQVIVFSNIIRIIRITGDTLQDNRGALGRI